MPSTQYGPSGDPRLKTRSYKAIVAYWQQTQPQQCEATRCLLPGVPISYSATRGPASLDTGHLIPRALDQRTTWTIADTRPEHARCNRSAGVNLGRARRRRRDTRPATASRW